MRGITYLKLFNGINAVLILAQRLGALWKDFSRKGITPVKFKSWVEFDGAMNVQRATNGLVSFMDLTHPHPADERPCVKGDWVLSLEVAEYSSTVYRSLYIRNLRCSCAVLGPLSRGLCQHRLVDWGMSTQKSRRMQSRPWQEQEVGFFVVDEEATEALHSTGFSFYQSFQEEYCCISSKKSDS